MEVKIRIAEKKDVESMYRLIKELALYEKEPDAVKISEADLEEAGFGMHPLYHCFVAEAADQIVGMALVYPRYSTWQGPVIHLEDLIVTQSQRGKGLGSKLLDAVVAYGKEQGVRRISWEVLDWNEPAIKFYESKGANVMRDWDVVQLDQKGIENYFNA